MSNLSKQTIEFMRGVLGTQTARPLGVLLFKNRLYPDTTVTYSLVLTSTTVGITNGTTPYTITYVGKSVRQVALELSNSPYPIDIISLAEVSNLVADELKASGTSIPASFDIEDISNDGKSVIVRCTRWSAVYNKTSSIGVKAPYLEGAALPWWAPITNGTFLQTYKGIIYHFGIPEYIHQTWSSLWGKPFADVEGEPANFITQSSIQLSRFPVLFKNNNIQFLSSSFDKVYPSSIIKDVDTINGIVYIKEGIQLPKDSFVYYTYLENSLVYKDINLNGHFLQNPFVLDKYVLFYALPYKSNSGINRSRSIYHSIGSSIEDAIFKIEVENPFEPIAILGAVNVKPFGGLDTVNVTDTRSYGGGLREDELGQATEKKFKESQYFFDIGKIDGIPYPGSAAIVVELPSELKEVMSVSDIKDRANKFIAAGVYPIFRFNTNEYTSQFEPTDYTADISLASYTIAESNASGDISVFGNSGEAAGWINPSMALPDSLYTTGIYSGTSFLSNPDTEGNVLKLSPGQKFEHTYIRSSPEPIFSYEERTQDGQWNQVTVRDTTVVGTGQLSANSVSIDSQYGYKEIRNFTGLAAYVPSSTFWDDLVYSTSSIMMFAKELTTGNQTRLFTGYIPDVTTAITAPAISGVGTTPLVEPIYKYYGSMYPKNIMTGYIVANGQMLATYGGLTGTATFPRRQNYNTFAYDTPYTGQYNALRDIYLYSTFAKHKVNESLDLFSSNTQAINLTGAASWLNTSTRATALNAYSGAIKIANKVMNLNPFSGSSLINSDVIPVYYIPSTDSVVPILTGYSNSEISTGNNQYLNTEYIKSFAAMYSMQVSPVNGALYSGRVGMNVNYNPKTIAFSGISNATYYFDSYFDSPTYTGTALPDTWLTKYNRISKLAAHHFDNVCTAMDDLYYGNRCWAGYTGYQAKDPIYYEETFSPDLNLSGDLSWGTDILSWPNGSNGTMTDLFPLAISGVYSNQLTIEPYLTVGAARGGIFPPGSITAIKNLMWLPIHKAKQDPMFTSFDTDRLVSTFETSMAAVLKGSLNQDGILIEGGSFKNKQAPYSGSVPSELFSACAKAIEYYTLTGNTIQARKWTSIAEGLFRTTEALYSLSGGYPYNPVYSISPAGDPGSVPLMGYLSLLAAYTGSWTVDQYSAITGKIAPRL